MKASDETQWKSVLCNLHGQCTAIVFRHDSSKQKVLLQPKASLKKAVHGQAAFKSPL